MITDRIENIGRYAALFPGITELVSYMKSHKLADIESKTALETITLIPLKSPGTGENYDPALTEAHRKLMDIHITLSGTDVISYANLDDEATVSKTYEDEHDYLLATSDKLKTLTVPSGYFCIIPNNFAHMALYGGHKDVQKIVVKMDAGQF